MSALKTAVFVALSHPCTGHEVEAMQSLKNAFPSIVGAVQTAVKSLEGKMVSKISVLYSDQDDLYLLEAMTHQTDRYHMPSLTPDARLAPGVFLADTWPVDTLSKSDEQGDEDEAGAEELAGIDAILQQIFGGVAQADAARLEAYPA